MSQQKASRPRRREHPATLRTKTFRIIAATFIGLLLILYIPLRTIILGSFIELEQQDTRQNIERVLNALADNTAELNRTAGDYAGWDDTYAFIEDANQAYIDTNFIDATFAADKLSLVVLVDNAGKVVFSKAFDLRTGRATSVPLRFQSFASADDPLLRHTDITSGTTGIVVLPEGPMILAARPILTSAYTGPSRGTLIMGRALDMAEIQRLAQTTRLSLQMFRLDDPQLPSDIQAARASASEETPTVVQPLSEESIAGYALLKDIYGTPSMIARVESARGIYQRGKTSLLYFTLSLLVVSVVFSMVMLSLLERVILSRLISLGADVRHIGTSGDLAVRVPVRDQDELSDLAAAINGMLGALEKAQIERKRAEEERACLQEEVIRAKEQFIQMAIHDLKNPLTAIKGFLRMLALSGLTPMQREMLDGVGRCSNDLLQIVETILDTARLEEDRLELRRDISDIAALLKDCAAELRAWADQEQKQVRVETGWPMPPVLIDAGLVRRVMINLLSNAIKYTPPKTVITLCAEVSDDIRLSVRDNGLGIPPEQQRRLFERFGATGRGGAGQSSTGLGLTFCKLAVEAHGGSIAVDSAPGQGTTFTVILPLHPASDLPASWADQVALPPAAYAWQTDEGR